MIDTVDEVSASRTDEGIGTDFVCGWTIVLRPLVRSASRAAVAEVDNAQSYGDELEPVMRQAFVGARPVGSVPL